MNPHTSLFDGSFCRKPAQNFGGRSSNDNRDALLQRAKQEREKREKERLAAQSIVVLQSTVRSFLVRLAAKRRCREEFEKNWKATYDNEIELGNQLRLINFFFDAKLDVLRLNQLAKAVLAQKDLLLAKCYSNDYLWVGRIRVFLRKCLAILIVAHSSPVGTAFIRVIEVLTEPFIAKESGKPSYFTVMIWLDLICRGSFFQTWRKVMTTGRISPLLQDAYVKIFQHPISLVTKLSTITEPAFTAFKDRITGLEATNLIFANFTAAYCTNVVPGEKFIDDLQRLTSEFPVEDWLRFLLNYPTANDSIDDNIKAEFRHDRSVLMVVVLITSKTSSHLDPLLLTKILIKYLHAIDKRNGPDEFATDYLYRFHVTVFPFPHLEDIDDQFHSIECIEYLKELNFIHRYLIECVLEKKMKILELINSRNLENWDFFYQIVSTLICIDEKNGEKIPHLVTVAFKRDLLRQVFVKLLRSDSEQPPNLEELLVFCWGFNHLLNTLHDDEFLGAIPMNNMQELKIFIRSLIELYEDIMVKEGIKYDAFVNTLKFVILWSLRSLYDRNTRLQYLTEDCFLSKMAHVYLPIHSHTIDFEDFTQNTVSLFRGQTFFLTDPHDLSAAENRLLIILNEAPFLINFDNRILIWQRLLENDKANREVAANPRDHIQIRRSLLYEDAYEKLSYENVPDLRVNVRISLVNIVGVPEAGVDGGGLLREFLTLATKAGVDPNRGFFRLDSQNRIYPNPLAKKLEPNFRKHFFLMGRLVGKALYEQILLELPMAAYFIQSCITRYVPSAVDYLATLDPALHRNLLNLKRYEGDWSALGLDFTVGEDEFGQFHAIELKKNGTEISVDKSNVIEYIHLVSEFKINKETEDECRAFRNGLLDVIPMLRMFSWREMQTLISGSEKPIDVQDWKSHTNYSGGYDESHPTIELFWKVVESFEETYLRKLLKFVTSCSRPPLLGFKDLVPNFGIQNAGITDRLPTAATCMNLLKLPQYSDAPTLNQKLRYVVDAQAGFELS